MQPNLRECSLLSDQKGFWGLCLGVTPGWLSGHHTGTGKEQEHHAGTFLEHLVGLEGNCATPGA